jgi:hypothetical protein
MSALITVPRPSRRLKHSSAAYGSLVILPEWAWLYHEQSKATPGAGIHQLSKAVEKAAKETPTTARDKCSSTGPLYELLKNFENEGHDWIRGWLLRGQDAPAHVILATPEQIRLARVWWDFTAHCEAADLETPNTSYCRWIKQGLIPNLDFLKWLFGGSEPAGVFVVTEALQRLRRERTQIAIVTAIRMQNDSWHRLWRRVAARLKMRRRSEDFKEFQAGLLRAGSLTECKVWPHLDRKTQECVKRFADAARLSACCERAGIAESNYYNTGARRKT